MMLLHNADELILDAPGYIYEEKYDGERACLHVDKDGDITIIARSGRNITHEFPELLKAELPPCSVFDGEIFVPANSANRDKPTTAGRTNVKSPSMCVLLSQLKPAVFMCFDVLFFSGEKVEVKPYMERRSVLQTIPDQGVFVKVKQYENGHEVWERVLSEGGEGIVAKKRDSPYQNRRSYDWLKVKTWKEGDFKVVGYTSEKRDISALILEGGYKVNFSVDGAEYNRLLPRLKAHPEDFVVKVKYFSKSEEGLRFPILRAITEMSVMVAENSPMEAIA